MAISAGMILNLPWETWRPTAVLAGRHWKDCAASASERRMVRPAPPDTLAWALIFAAVG